MALVNFHKAFAVASTVLAADLALPSLTIHLLSRKCVNHKAPVESAKQCSQNSLSRSVAQIVFAGARQTKVCRGAEIGAWFAGDLLRESRITTYDLCHHKNKNFFWNIFQTLVQDTNLETFATTTSRRSKSSNEFVVSQAVAEIVKRRKPLEREGPLSPIQALRSNSRTTEKRWGSPPHSVQKNAHYCRNTR
jgi:hypothetical protein